MKPRARKRNSRSARPDSQRILAVGDLSLNVTERSLHRGSKNIRLTPKLCALLHIFMTNHGKVLTRRFLVEEVWETSYMGDTRTLDVHIHLLRKTLEDDPRNPVYLHTVRGAGYRFDVPDV